MEKKQGEVTTQTKLNYAWGLIKSQKNANQRLGVDLLKGNKTMFICEKKFWTKYI
jgi:hypothetical protein